MDALEQKITTLKEVSHKVVHIQDLGPLFDQLSDSKLVLLGEASHGTHDYYTWRTEISKYLIENHGFNFIAMEGDWPDFYRVNRFVKNYDNSDISALNVLKQFNRWPTWMWANWETESLVRWLHGHNEKFPMAQRVGIYGLDVYSLWESMEAIIDYLQEHKPSLLPTAKRAMGCFEPFSDEIGLAYARSLKRYMPKTCENEVVSLLQEIIDHAKNFNKDQEASLNMQQNAYVAKNAENYYRAMVSINSSSWNLRDQHMTDTLKRLFDFYGPEAKGIVWEHNTHVGDARATDMVLENSVNVGQLVREQLADLHPKIVGFGSYAGSVIAGSEWGSPMRRMNLPEAIGGSWEYLMHRTGKGNQLVLMDELREYAEFKAPLQHRAIGVVYHPKYESIGNYVPSVMPERYDAFLHIDITEALHPIHIFTDKTQLPETYPWAY